MHLQYCCSDSAFSNALFFSWSALSIDHSPSCILTISKCMAPVLALSLQSSDFSKLQKTWKWTSGLSKVFTKRRHLLELSYPFRCPFHLPTGLYFFPAQQPFWESYVNYSYISFNCNRKYHPHELWQMPEALLTSSSMGLPFEVSNYHAGSP